MRLDEKAGDAQPRQELFDGGARYPVLIHISGPISAFRKPDGARRPAKESFVAFDAGAQLAIDRSVA
jgi:hypothetical protein